MTDGPNDEQLDAAGPLVDAPEQAPVWPVILATARAGLAVVVATTLLTGVGYPLVMMVLAHALFPDQAGGSLVTRGNRVIGSRLIGQSFTDPGHFWGRPSATTTPYDASSSTGSNLGPTNPALVDAVRARVAALRAAHPGNRASVPIDLVTASGSGLDPNVSPAGARYQVARVARARGIDAAAVAALIDRQLTGRQLGILGEPRLNVLALNLALDARFPRGGAAAR